MKKLSRFAALFLGVAGLSLGAATCRADTQHCLWLNAATAGGVLGGEVEMSVTPLTVLGDGTCEFTRGKGASAAMLRIVVHTMEAPSKDFATYVSKCGGPAIPLKAIGNEAVECVNKSNVANGEEQVIGRVRERVFVLTIRRSTGIVPGKDGLSDDTRNMAEQVAGSLF